MIIRYERESSMPNVSTYGKRRGSDAEVVWCEVKKSQDDTYVFHGENQELSELLFGCDGEDA